MKTVPSILLRLSKSLKAQKCFKPSRITPAALNKAYKQKRLALVTRVINGQKTVVACGALWPTMSSKWLEIGTMYVSESHTRQGLGSEIFHTLLNLETTTNKSLFLVTRNGAVGRIAMAADWQHDSKRVCCNKAIHHSRPLGDGREIYYRLATAS